MIHVAMQHKYSVETMSDYIQRKHTMKTLSDFMLGLLERLSEMFPGSNYQSRLDEYLSTKGITDTAQLEKYIQQYQYSQKETYL